MFLISFIFSKLLDISFIQLSLPSHFLEITFNLFRKFLNIAIEKRNVENYDYNMTMKIIILRRDFVRTSHWSQFSIFHRSIHSLIWKKKKNWIRNVWNETIISGVKNAAHSSQWTRETRDSARFLRDPSSCKHEGPPPLPFLSQLFSRSTPGEHIKAFAPLGIFSCKFPSPE